jgi:hypothetical protein
VGQLEAPIRHGFHNLLHVFASGRDR